jgi:hypothetical protein
MSTNLGTVLVGLGYDLSALEKGAPEAFRLINSQTLGMSAEMKRASREGAESFRLIDEALGIHISRPLTRLLTQEFPGFAQGLQSVLGAGVVGALGVAGIEFFDKIAKSIEHAQKAQEEFAAAMRKTGDVIGDTGAGHARTMKEIELELAEKQGVPSAKMQLVDFKIDTTAMEQAKKSIGEITDAMEKEAKAATDAGKWTTQFWDAVGYVAENFFSRTSESEEQAARKFQDFKHVLDDIMRGAAQDPLSGMRESLKRLNDELSTTGADIARKMTAIQTANAISARGRHPDSGVDEAALANEQKYFEMLKSEGVALEHILQEDEGRRKLAAAPDIGNELERQLRAMESLQSVIGQGLGKLSPEQDPLKKLATEIQGFKIQAENAFREIGDSGASALDMRTATARLAEFESRLDRVMQKAKADAALMEAPKWSGTIAPTGAAPQFTMPSIMPTLGAGGATAAQFDAFKSDATAQIKLMAQAFGDLITPAQKFKLIQDELDLVLKNSDGSWKDAKNGASAYAAALQEAQKEMTKASDAQKKMLEDNGAAGGFQAFLKQLEGQDTQGATGKAVFNMLNQGLQGFEDETVKALTGAKTNWSNFFLSLDQMALKFVLNSLISQMLKSLDKPGGMFASWFGGSGGAGGGAGAAAADTPGMFASGTDYAPGGMAWVGEEGPELVNLPTGASVTPNSALRGANITLHMPIDARGGEIGVEEKIARALERSAPQLITRAVVAASEVQRRTPH